MFVEEIMIQHLDSFLMWSRFIPCHHPPGLIWQRNEVAQTCCKQNLISNQSENLANIAYNPLYM